MKDSRFSSRSVRLQGSQRGNCLTLRRLGPSRRDRGGPTKAVSGPPQLTPKLVWVPINPLIPPPWEVAPDFTEWHKRWLARQQSHTGHRRVHGARSVSAMNVHASMDTETQTERKRQRRRQRQTNFIPSHWLSSWLRQLLACMHVCMSQRCCVAGKWSHRVGLGDFDPRSTFPRRAEELERAVAAYVLLRREGTGIRLWHTRALPPLLWADLGRGPAPSTATARGRRARWRRGTTHRARLADWHLASGGASVGGAASISGTTPGTPRIVACVHFRAPHDSPKNGPRHIVGVIRLPHPAMGPFTGSRRRHSGGSPSVPSQGWPICARKCWKQAQRWSNPPEIWPTAAPNLVGRSRVANAAIVSRSRLSSRTRSRPPGNPLVAAGLVAQEVGFASEATAAEPDLVEASPSLVETAPASVESSPNSA